MIQAKTRGMFSPADLLRRLCTAWLTAVMVGYLFLEPGQRSLTGLESICDRSFPVMCSVVVIFFLLLNILARFWNTRLPEKILMTVAFCLTWLVSLQSSYSDPYMLAGLLILCLLLIYCAFGHNIRLYIIPKRRAEGNVWRLLLIAASILFFLLVSFWTVGRVLTFSSPTYDFGIFSQMFHHMRTTGLPNTTLERDGMLSHFAVHVSPIYYLLLPFYAIYPSPVTLQILQAALLTSAVIPLWKLGKHHGLNGPWLLSICLILLMYPAYSGGTGYDIHENAFLTPLLLWLFYSVDRRQPWQSILFTVLILSVKEDAAVYTAAVGLWLMIRSIVYPKKNWKDTLMGSFILAVSVLWFVLVTGYLSKYGDGVMTYRYQNFMYDASGSLLTVIKAVLLCPLKALYECVDSEKLEYILLTMAPLLGLPLMTRKYERLILWIPYLLVNLMSDYKYQHDIFFQYSFGSSACLIYLALVNLADLTHTKLSMPLKVLPLIASLALSAVLFATSVLPTALYYPSAYAQYHDHYTRISHTLDQVPDSASVTATTFYTQYLSQRDVIYDLGYASREHVLSTEYIVLDPKAESALKTYGGYDTFIALLRQEGYIRIAQLEKYVEIYHKP